MPLTYQSTFLFLYERPNFVIRTAFHPLMNAWVQADPSDPFYQAGMWDLASLAVQNGEQVEIICDAYTEQDGDRRFYSGVTTISRILHNEARADKLHAKKSVNINEAGETGYPSSGKGRSSS